MALEAITGAGYYESAVIPSKIDTTQDAGAAGYNISEVRIAVKTTGKGQAGNGDQSNGQSPEQNMASEKQIKNAISKANSKLKIQRTRCEFSYNEDTKRVSIKVLDEDTEEVIKEIPPEETLEMVKKMWELAGLLVDERR